jgi:holliday junction DNA helicase RuvA
MYEFLIGRAERVLPTAVVLEIGGVGWFVETSLKTSANVRSGQTTRLLLHVRTTEDGVRLFGFLDDDERDLFRRLLKTNGVGPAHALAMCSAMTPGEVWNAVAAADAKLLSSPKGIGPKLAARLIAELKDDAERRTTAVWRGAAGRSSEGTARDDDAVDALSVLGYSESTARKAVLKARETLGAAASTEAVVKEALRATR